MFETFFGRCAVNDGGADTNLMGIIYVTKVPNSDKDQTRQTDAIEITPQMIEAGVMALHELVLDEDSDAEIVTHLLRSAFRQNHIPALSTRQRL